MSIKERLRAVAVSRFGKWAGIVLAAGAVVTVLARILAETWIEDALRTYVSQPAVVTWQRFVAQETGATLLFFGSAVLVLLFLAVLDQGSAGVLIRGYIEKKNLWRR